MDLTLAESLDGIYHLVLAGGALIGCFLVALGFPGQFLPALLAIACWAGGWAGEDGETLVGGLQVITLIGLGLLAEGFEFLSGLIGGKAAGARWRGAFGGMAGGFVGAIFGNLIIPLLGGLVGIVLGTFVGAIMGELYGEDSANADQAIKVGLASAVGRASGLVAKLALNFGIGFWAVLQLF